MGSIFNILLNNVVSGPCTDPFPFGETYSPKTIRGRVRIDPDLCMGCGMCRHSCVSPLPELQTGSGRGDAQCLPYAPFKDRRPAQG